MSIWAIVPARPLEEGKSRLASALTPVERHRLNETFFRQTLDACSSVLGADRTLVVSRSPALLELAAASGIATLIEQAPHGLNEALDQAAASVLRYGATSVLSVSCDLPFLAADDLRKLLGEARDGELAIASDRAGTGTNALVISPIGAVPYRYGPNSFQAHRNAARQAGLSMHVVKRAGLAFDVDTPDDLEQMEEIGRETARARLHI